MKPHDPTVLVTDVTGNQLTYDIIGAAMAVHNALGPGYKEEVYERALAVELGAREIPAQRQFNLEVTHDTGASVGLLLNFGRRRLEYRRIFPPRDASRVGRLGRDNVRRKG